MTCKSTTKSWYIQAWLGTWPHGRPWVGLPQSFEYSHIDLHRVGGFEGWLARHEFEPAKKTDQGLIWIRKLFEGAQNSKEFYHCIQRFLMFDFFLLVYCAHFILLSSCLANMKVGQHIFLQSTIHSSPNVQLMPDNKPPRPVAFSEYRGTQKYQVSTNPKRNRDPLPEPSPVQNNPAAFPNKKTTEKNLRLKILGKGHSTTWKLSARTISGQQ